VKTEAESSFRNVLILLFCNLDGGQSPRKQVGFEVLAAVSAKMAAIISLMMEAAKTSETLVNFYQTTRRYNPEDSHLQQSSFTNCRQCFLP
jgi:hypothetical protein